MIVSIFHTAVGLSNCVLTNESPFVLQHNATIHHTAIGPRFGPGESPPLHQLLPFRQAPVGDEDASKILVIAIPCQVDNRQYLRLPSRDFNIAG